MTKFNVGDRVRAKGSEYDIQRRFRGEAVVLRYSGDDFCRLRFDSGVVDELPESELVLVASTKSLRAKYKAAPGKRGKVFIGEWNSPHSGSGRFYATADRRSRVEAVWNAIEENDASKEAFYSLIEAGGVFIRD